MRYASFLLVTAAAGANRTAIIEELKKNQNIYLISEIMGDFDIFANARIKDLTSLAELVSEVQRFSGVERLEALLLTHTYFSFTRIPKSRTICDKTELSQNENAPN